MSQTGSNPTKLNLGSSAKEYSFKDLTAPSSGLLNHMLNGGVVVSYPIIVNSPIFGNLSANDKK
jgi:hypothetical protein